MDGRLVGASRESRDSVAVDGDQSESAKGSTTGDQSGEGQSCRGSGSAPHATSPHWTDEAPRSAAARFPVTPRPPRAVVYHCGDPPAGAEFTGATSVRAYVCGEMGRPLSRVKVQVQLGRP